MMLQLISLKKIVSGSWGGNMWEIPLFDLEYIFLQLRAKSIGEISKFRILCPDDKKTYADVEIDLTKVVVEVDEGHDNKIIIDDKKQVGLYLIIK